MRFARFKIRAIILLSLMIASPLMSMAGEIRNINFAVFQKVDDDFEFDPIVMGKFSDFIAVMDGAQVLLLSHTKDSVHGDVISLQQDVLRESSEGLNDIGISCSLSFLENSEPDNLSFELGGLCKILDSLNENITAIIPMAGLPDTDQGVEAWVELHEDEASGTAFYANVSTGD
ncbi:hypothetical protein D8Y20_11015 [Mariprofundus sp. EBB-1]|uniref:hypothetical protein n=1 Tax=Mariprofundus sp. EBB-1 TaxID=2650971 RepID=UPI000EF17FE9|nr:hypothetical protein [Mariprofundus sp. EBB-1]RLL50805.1 hypothetical protein D8Y20_11015 [Mariprofundus sp. EBB-1]